MPRASSSSFKNSTNIRVMVRYLIHRSLIRTGFHLAPAWAADHAARFFLAPLRRPAPGRTRYVSRETPLAVEAPSGPVAAWLYGRAENPHGETVLLVHGWEDDHLSWAVLADRLVREGYRVLALDLPGHGRSPGPIAPIPVQAAAVAAVGREAAMLDLTPFRAVIAHSLGGTATLIAATEMGLRAERFAILASPNHPRLFAGAMMKMLGLTAQQTARAFDAIERIVGRSMDSLYLPPKLRQLAAPGLILHSRDDKTVPLQHSQENAAAWPRADFRILEGLGHRRLMSDPGVHEMLLHFVNADAPADAFGLKTDAA
jgi:pimeloyl-ACP methyl ester carboxylesterase